MMLNSGGIEEGLLLGEGVVGLPNGAIQAEILQKVLSHMKYLPEMFRNVSCMAYPMY